MIAFAEDVRSAAAAGAEAAGGSLLTPRLRGATKRALDIGLGALILLVTGPIILGFAAAIRFRHGIAPFYAHPRIGRGGRRFNCLKLRTMRIDSDAALARLLADDCEAAREWAAAQKLKRDPRVLGRLGRFLRVTSLDELPQLLNVLRGEMSLVGPRPVVRDELGHYGGQIDWYLAVRPGITGPWQVGGRSEASYAARVRMDVGYARAPSLRRDLAILVRTLAVPFGQRGAC